MHESELGAPLYRRSEAVAVNGDHRRVITVAQYSVGVVRGLSVITEVQWVRFGAKLAGVWVLRVSSTERGWRGPVGGRGCALCLSATVMVQWGCAGVHEPRGGPGNDGRRWVAWRAGSGPRWPPREAQPPQKLPTPAAALRAPAGDTAPTTPPSAALHLLLARRHKTAEGGDEGVDSRNIMRACPNL